MTNTGVEPYIGLCFVQTTCFAYRPGNSDSKNKAASQLSGSQLLRVVGGFALFLSMYTQYWD